MRKINKTSGAIRESYKRDTPMLWVIVQIVGALALMVIAMAFIIMNGK